MITDAVKAIADMFANLFNWRTVAVDNKALSEVIDDKKDLEKACNYAEEVIEYVREYAYWDTIKQQERFDHLVKKFRRYR